MSYFQRVSFIFRFKTFFRPIYKIYINEMITRHDIDAVLCYYWLEMTVVSKECLTGSNSNNDSNIFERCEFSVWVKLFAVCLILIWDLELFVGVFIFFNAGLYLERLSHSFSTTGVEGLDIKVSSLYSFHFSAYVITATRLSGFKFVTTRVADKYSNSVKPSSLL